MVVLTVKLTKQEKAKLESTAKDRDVSMSALVRELIRSSYEQHDIAAALIGIETSVKALLNQKQVGVCLDDLKQVEQALVNLQGQLKSLSGTDTGGVATTNGGIGNDVTEIRRIVTLIGRAMPAVSKQI